MTIRRKIYALAGALLALFGLVVGGLSLLQRRNADHLENIVRYQLQITRLLANLDVATFEYELAVERMRRRGTAQSAEDLANGGAHVRGIAARIKEEFRAMQALLDAAVANDRQFVADRLRLSRTQGAVHFLVRSVDPFVAVGEATVAALAAGNAEAAREAATDFTRFEETFGPDLATIRQDVVAVTDHSVQAIYRNQRLDMWFSFALFVVASGVGLGISGIGASRVVSGLRQLVATTRAIEAGQMDMKVTVVTRDEVGELALAFNRMIEELRAQAHLRETFGSFLDPRIVSRLIATGGGNGDAAADQGERRIVTVFFSDIKGFSGISERLTAGTVVKLLNRYFGATAEVIRRHNGIIDKYIGDAVMAFWAAPFVADDHAAAACLAALDQQTAIEALRAELPDITGLRRDTPDLAVRMGIATGEVVIGTIGSPMARSYTVIGDTVNLASRLEGVNKLYGTRIIIGEDTWRTAQQSVEARELDTVTVAGKTEPIRIYEVMGRHGALAPAQAALRDAYAAGLAAYRARDWDGAAARFRECLDHVPEDGPAALLLGRIEQFRHAPPPEDWGGVWHLLAK
ncbi:MAG TPA: adenylate/guanylate cyclase domain-containing protein [Stellaceae bacterium]|jgi:adenylate cyclase